ncbi:DNA-3-methyladenine glycosylase I [Christensenellaceae bacterium OttesenSCG-928-L17]|nr:DNA-3-methyladenine glycosylase I [Christensenellaceae bacterium OttesenSCG-928-L17]
MATPQTTRCAWARGELYEQYHDEEWGVPMHDERELFERLILEGMQAGLSWSLILDKRAAMKEAFANFEPEKLRAFTEEDVERLMQNPGIIRNRRKILSAIHNAHMYVRLCEEHGSLDAFFWNYVNGTPIVNRIASASEMPATTPLSDQISKDLKKLGFKFVGSTIMYAFMQSIGMVNDHFTSCFCHPDNQTPN